MELAKRSSKQNLHVLLVVVHIWLLTTLTLHQFVQVSGMPTDSEEVVPLSVNRRLLSPDIVTLTNSTGHINCDAHTYLVDERRCIDNQVLLNGTSKIDM